MRTGRAGAVLITGASSGIGASIARRIADKYPLLLHGRDEQRLRTLRDALPDAERHQTWRADFTDLPQTTVSLTELLDALPLPIESVVHSAGMTAVGPIRSFEPAETARMFDVNLLSIVRIVQSLLAHSRHGRSLRNVVLISSAASLRGEKGAAVYSASKAAVDALARSLAAELAPAIRVNAILPGLVASEMSASTIERDDFQERVASRYPLGIGSVDDVAGAVETLLSNETRWITGGSWVVDGGTIAAGVSRR